MYKMVDLHVHSSESDGKLTPNKLVEYASVKNVDLFALTDHDTTEGIEAAINAAKKFSIKVIPGIELSTTHNGESIHILGYFRGLGYKDKFLLNFLKEITDFRLIRAKKITENLEKFFDIKIDFEQVLEMSKGVVARSHIAKAIIDAGYDYSWEYIFDHIIGKDSPAYVENKKVTLAEGINLLKERDALVVLAHPILVKNTPVEQLMNFDFDGIEAIYPLNDEKHTKHYIELAKKYNKLITAGSDFHGLGKADTQHGDLASQNLGEENINEFLKALKY